jgi:hypothetical protein
MGISYGVLALNFDKAFIVDEKTTIPGAKLSDAKSYKVVANAAVGYLNEAIALSASSFSVPSTWMGTAGAVSNTTLIAMANSYIARILSNMPRNATELAAVNWAAVKTAADEMATFRILSFDGKEMLFRKVALQTGDNIVVLTNFGAIAKGNYILEVTTSTNKFIKKIIKN